MSADNFETTWLQQNLQEGATNRALQAIEELGRALPCTVTAVNGSLVTVRFEVAGPYTLPNLTLPKAESQWLRTPTQVGDHGITVPADTFLGAVSGQGSGTAELGKNYGNLSTLVFVPIGNANFAAAPDANKAWINGPNGVVISDTAQTIAMIVDHITGTVQIGGSGTTPGDALCRVQDVQAAITATVTALVNYIHANCQAGTSSAPGPTPPTVTGSSKTFSS